MTIAADIASMFPAIFALSFPANLDTRIISPIKRTNFCIIFMPLSIAPSSILDRIQMALAIIIIDDAMDMITPPNLD